MKSRMFLTVLLLGTTTTIGTSQEEITDQTINEARAKLPAEVRRLLKLGPSVYTLIGIKGIYVLFEPLSENDKSAGLTMERLTTDLELKLRLAGIRIVTREDWIRSDDTAVLYVNIHSVGDDLIAFNVDVKVEQVVYLARDRQLQCSATTWHEGLVASCGSTLFAESARDAVKCLTDQFLNDYLKANPMN